jgi:hypothetical protein
MEMGFDFHNGSQGSNPLAGTGFIAGQWWPGADHVADGAAPRRPDWASLKVRFAALHALRRSIALSAAETLPAGSFLGAAEAVLASARGAGTGVNRLCSGNGKSAAGMVPVMSPTIPRAATEDHR